MDVKIGMRIDGIRASGRISKTFGIRTNIRIDIRSDEIGKPHEIVKLNETTKYDENCNFG